jgi:dienelactone hydrolase
LRLRIYLKSLRPAWLEIVDAADWLRGDPAAREDALARVPAFFGRYLLD